MKNIKILLPASLAYSAAVREIAEEAAKQAGFERKQTNMCRLVVDEIFMNAVRYGSDKESHVFIEGVINENQLIFAVEDEGKGVKKVSAGELKTIIQQEVDNVSLKKTHGRGLAQITSNLVKAYEIYDKEGGGLRIEFVLEKQDETTTEREDFLQRDTSKILPEVKIDLSGSIDLNNIEEHALKISSILEEHTEHAFRLVLNMEHLDYCNSTFLGYLASWQSDIENKGGESVIQNPSESIFEIMDLVGITKIFVVEGRKTKTENVQTTSQFHSID